MRDMEAASAPLRPVRLGPADVLLDRKTDGTIILRSPQLLGAYPQKLTERLEHWAKAAPDRVFLAQRAADGSWRKFTYAEALAQVRSVAQSLLRRRLSADRPIAILSGNDIEHALLGLAANPMRRSRCPTR
jgi:feruloyl-CoA synthase